MTSGDTVEAFELAIGPLYSLRTNRIENISSESRTKLSYDLRSVGQFALVSGHHLGPVTKFFFFETIFTQLLLRGALSDERTGL
jgi:hypothetical protein